MFQKQTRFKSFFTAKFAEDVHGTLYLMFPLVVVSSHSHVAFSFLIHAVIIMNL